MIYQGNAVSVQLLDDGIAELKFDLQGESVNKFNQETVEDLGKAPTSPNSLTCSNCRKTKSPAGV